MERIPIIDEDGNRIGEEDRSVAHEKELLHPAVRVFVKLADGRFAFQRRSLIKETNPGKRTFTATGHVKAGQTLEEAAAEELFEETGIQADIQDLTYLGKYKDKITTGKIGKKFHRVLGYFYGYRFSGNLEDLKADGDEVEGFEAYSLQALKDMRPEEKERFLTIVFEPEIIEMFENYENKN